MPLLDHFHPPLHPRRKWLPVHSAWSTYIAEQLNEHWLPEGYFAEPQTVNARVEIDVGTFETDFETSATSANGGAVATAPVQTWSPPAPAVSTTLVFPETLEVKVFRDEGSTLVGAIELVSPANKDRPGERQAFLAKCAGYLTQGISLVVVDVVTSKRFNLHNELMSLLDAPAAARFPEGIFLYGVAYRPVIRNEEAEFDIWRQALKLGLELPTLPLRLSGDKFVPVELESAYTKACEKLRIVDS